MQRLSVTRENAVAIVSFDNPPKGYMDAPMVDALDATTAELVADDAVRVLVFTGSLPGVFIQHYDVGELNGLAKGLRKRGLTFSEKRPAPVRTLDHVFDRLAGSPKPAIAAMNGNAMGGGFEFCLAATCAWRKKARTRSACRKSTSAFCQAAAARSVWRGWSARRERWNWCCAGARSTPTKRRDWAWCMRLSTARCCLARWPSPMNWPANRRWPLGISSG